MAYLWESSVDSRLRKEGERRDETPSRDAAIRRYVAGDRPAESCRAWGRSTPWLDKWRKRDDPPHPAWARRRSRAPHDVAAPTPPEVERLVGAIRQRVVQPRDAQRGAFAIPWPRQPWGVRPVPALGTLTRLL